jgi:lysine N6-hydroxylase
MERISQDNGEFLVDEDFAVRWDGPTNRCIFVQNAVRGQRGLPDVNLSLNAWRAQRIVGRLSGNYPHPQHSSFIEWTNEHSNTPVMLRTESTVQLKEKVGFTSN